MTPKAIIFDGGGTIWDSMAVLYDSYIWAFEQLGLCKRAEFPYTMRECNALSSLRDFNTEHGKAKGFLAVFLSGKSMKSILNKEDPNAELNQLVEEIRAKHDDFDSKAEMLGDLLAQYLYEIFDDTKYPLCKNVKNTLEKLKNTNNLKIALVSNRRKGSTLRILESHNLREFFDVIITWEDQKNPKPHPEGVLKAMELLNVQPEDCIFVGDSAVDIISAREAGVRCVGVLTGMATRDILEKSGANYIINDMSELFEILNIID